VEMRVAIMAAHIKTQGDFVNVASAGPHRIRGMIARGTGASNLFPAGPD
jgi:hypothetical protein